MFTRSVSVLLAATRSALPVRCFNSSVSSVTKIHRAIYARTYPVVVVLPNGATINVKYHEPRKIIKVSDRHREWDRRNPDITNGFV